MWRFRLHMVCYTGALGWLSHCLGLVRVPNTGPFGGSVLYALAGRFQLMTTGSSQAQQHSLRPLFDVDPLHKVMVLLSSLQDVETAKQSCLWR